MSSRLVRKWIFVPVAVISIVAVWIAVKRSAPETETWVPYGGRGRVGQLLLELTGGSSRGIDSIQVPEGFTVEQAAGEDLVTYGVFFSFDDRGRLFVCESAGKNTTDEEVIRDPSFRISVLEDTNGDGVFDISKVFADHITLALGAQWDHGSLYVAAPPDLLRFDDSDNDGVADHREVVLTGWPLKSNATTLHGPYLGPDGWMYLTYSPDAPGSVEAYANRAAALLGDLDLFVTRYYGFTTQANRECLNNSGGRDYCGPGEYPPCPTGSIATKARAASRTSQAQPGSVPRSATDSASWPPTLTVTAGPISM